MKITLLLLSLLAGAAASAQHLPDIGVTVRINNGQKTIVAEIKPVGTDPRIDTRQLYYWYGTNLIHQTQGGYSGKLLNGTYHEYDPDKNLKEQGLFSKGLKNGVWKTWNAAGALLTFITYDQGWKNGPFRLYNEGGQLLQFGHYDHNRLNGQLRTYHQDSTIVVTYQQGRLVPARASRSFWQRINFFKKQNRSAKPQQPKVKA